MRRCGTYENFGVLFLHFIEAGNVQENSSYESGKLQRFLLA
jgi:hypothetical protein